MDGAREPPTLRTSCVIGEGRRKGGKKKKHEKLLYNKSTKLKEKSTSMFIIVTTFLILLFRTTFNDQTFITAAIIVRQPIQLLTKARLCLVASAGTITSSAATCRQRRTQHRSHGLAFLHTIRGGSYSEDYEADDDDYVNNNTNNSDEDNHEEDKEEEEEEVSLQQQMQVEETESFIVYGIRKILLFSCHTSMNILKKAVKHKKMSFKLVNAWERKWEQFIYFFFPSSSVDDEKQAPFKDRDDEEGEDIGLYLIHTYISKEKVTSSSSSSSSIIRGGSLTDALIGARNEAKLLLVFIPANSMKNDVDAACVMSLTSEEVTQVAQNYKNGSYIIWSAKADSFEANHALKRFNVIKRKGLPILLVSYPITVQQQQKVIATATTLAQHHCNPPPSALTMSKWLKALRKRHSKEVAKMRHILKEQKLYKERQEGYVESIKSDVRRDIEERNKKAEEEAIKQTELQRLEERKQYRQGLLDDMLSEPPLEEEEDVITIGLRFPDGKSAQRRFLLSSTKMQSIFYWVEGQFDIEKEHVKLIAGAGGKSFTYANDSDASVGDVLSTTTGTSGTKRLVALRVIPTKKDESAMMTSKKEVVSKEEE